MNQMVFFDKYNDLLVFDCPKLEVLVPVLLAILDHNRSLNHQEDQQFLCFFEPLLNKVASVTKFQQAVRMCMHRKKAKEQTIQQIIFRRSAYCIQGWWRNLKLKKRLESLARIKQHISKINSPTIYLEQTVYQNINSIISQAHQAFRFKEQTIMFDFKNQCVHMQVEEAFDVHRYDKISVPRWMGVTLEPPSFQSTSHLNSVLALFHDNSQDCQIVPATKVLNYQQTKMDIDRSLYFLKIQCHSVLEARKRAIVLAYLTYDMTRHVFVKMSTAQMLENPYDHQNVYEVHQLYNLEVFDDPVNVAVNFASQQLQQH